MKNNLWNVFSCSNEWKRPLTFKSFLSDLVCFICGVDSAPLTSSHLVCVSGLVGLHLLPSILLLFSLLFQGGFRLLLLLLLRLLPIPIQFLRWSRSRCACSQQTHHGKLNPAFADVQRPLLEPAATLLLGYLAWRCTACCWSWRRGWGWRSSQRGRRPGRRICRRWPRVWALECSSAHWCAQTPGSEHKIKVNKNKNNKNIIGVLADAEFI